MASIDYGEMKVKWHCSIFQIWFIYSAACHFWKSFPKRQKEKNPEHSTSLCFILAPILHFCSLNMNITYISMKNCCLLYFSSGIVMKLNISVYTFPSWWPYFQYLQLDFHHAWATTCKCCNPICGLNRKPGNHLWSMTYSHELIFLVYLQTSCANLGSFPEYKADHERCVW